VRRIAVLDAPSNLGLRPPTATSVPGCYKAPGALRDHRLIDRLKARDAGCLTPPRYDPGDWRPGDGVAHAGDIARYSVQLADRIGAIIAAGEFPLILGGDCSVLLGAAVMTGRLDGRYGLVFVDGHSDFRHPGNASYVGAAAGEDLALVTGRGQPDLTGIEGRRPYFRDIDVAVLGIRPQDEYRIELQAAGIAHRAVPELRSDGAARSAQWARQVLQDCDGYWVHIDVDVLDPAVMPAVDAPDPGGIAYAELELLLAGLVNTSRCLGMELTVFDPDYDPDGQYAAELVELLVTGLAPVATTPADGAGSGSAGTRRGKVPLARSTFADFAPSPRRAPDGEEAPVAAPAPVPIENKAEVTPAGAPEPVTVPTQPGPPDEPPAPKRQVDHGPGKLRRRPPS
jgi:arginase